MFECKNIGEAEIFKKDQIFKNFGTGIDIFNSPDWDVLYLESRPFIDSDSYLFFQNLFNEINEIEYNVFSYPLYKDDEYLKFEILPDFTRFDIIMEKYNYRYTGGIAYGKDSNWAIYSEADNHILFFGFDKKMKKQVEKIFSYNPFIITRDKINEIYP